MRSGVREWVAPTLAAAGLAAAGLTLGIEMASFRTAVVGWATRDLETRTAMAAAQLAEPLATGDFRRVRDFGAECAGDGVRLTVFSGPGGLVYDSHPNDADGFLFATRPSDAYRVRLGLPRARVLAPFRRARIGLVLAGLVGGAGVLLVFFFTYRQRVKMREMAKTEKFRRTFVADVSHEIKTPLTGILGAVDLLGDDPPADARTRLLGLLKGEATRLNALVQEILDLARLEREGEILSRTPTDLASLASETVARFGPEAAAAGVRLALRGADAPRVADVDAARIEQALANLVENAIRHAHSPDVVVSVAADPDTVRLSVEDHGVGIAAAERDRVFERFHRVDPSRTAATGGAGLGLAIVRRIARLHGGDVVLSPAEPSGCRFTIGLPRFG